MVQEFGGNYEFSQLRWSGNLCQRCTDNFLGIL